VPQNITTSQVKNKKIIGCMCAKEINCQTYFYFKVFSHTKLAIKDPKH